MSMKKIAAALTAVLAAVGLWKASRPRPPQPEQGSWAPTNDTATTP